MDDADVAVLDVAPILHDIGIKLLEIGGTPVLVSQLLSSHLLVLRCHLWVLTLLLPLTLLSSGFG